MDDEIGEGGDGGEGDRFIRFNGTLIMFLEIMGKFHNRRINQECLKK